MSEENVRDVWHIHVWKSVRRMQLVLRMDILTLIRKNVSNADSVRKYVLKVPSMREEDLVKQRVV